MKIYIDKVAILLVVIVITVAVGWNLGILIKREYNLIKDYQLNLAVLHTLQEHQCRLKSIEATLIKAYHLPESEARYHAWLFDDYVAQNSARYQVCLPWELFAATFWHESRLTASALSHENAKAKAQVIEESFKRSLKRMRVPYEANVSIWHDWLTMSAGAEILSRNYAAGGYVYTIKAYVGGENYDDCTEINDYYAAVDKERSRLTLLYKEAYDSVKASNSP